MSQDLKITNAITKSPTFKSLATLMKAGSQALLLDCSGSMSSHDDNGELRRIDRLRNVASKFTNQIRQFIFQKDDCFEMAEIPEPSGGTPLAEAFQILKGNGITHVILITDGRPNSEGDAIRESRDLKIDSFFVGDPTDTQAIEFLKQLSLLNGGKFGETTFNQAGEQFLENEITLLIEDQVTETKTINL